MGAPCALCHERIDYGLQFPHRRAFTLDHKIPVWAGGQDGLENLQPAHMGCNASRGARETNRRRKMRQPAKHRWPDHIVMPEHTSTRW